MANGGVVDEVASLEVVGGVEHQVRPFHDFADVPGVEIERQRFEFHLRIDRREPSPGALRLGPPFPGVLLIVERLPLQVRSLDRVAVDEPHGPDSRSHQHVERGGTQGSGPHHQDPTAGQTFLPLRANAGEERLAGVAIIGHGAGHRKV